MSIPVWHAADQVSVENTGTSTGGTGSVSAPTNVESGDLICLVLLTPSGGDSEGVDNFTVPSGFSLIANNNNFSDSTAAAWSWYIKTSDGSEPSSYSYTVTSNPSSIRSFALTGRISGATGSGIVAKRVGSDIESFTLTMPEMSTASGSLVVGLAGFTRATGGLEDADLNVPSGWAEVLAFNGSQTAMFGATIDTSGVTSEADWDYLVDETSGDGVIQVEFSESGPTTNEEIFQANYADASAADPKVTALIRPADVQRSIDTDVSNLKDGPNLYTVEAIFDIGELSDLNPYNATTEKPRVFYVKDDQPGLRDGKNLLLKGYQIRSADPSVPVTCTFWG